MKTSRTFWYLSDNRNEEFRHGPPISNTVQIYAVTFAAATPIDTVFEAQNYDPCISDFATLNSATTCLPILQDFRRLNTLWKTLSAVLLFLILFVKQKALVRKQQVLTTALANLHLELPGVSPNHTMPELHKIHL